jgi:acyl-CoA thioester hydrolase
MNEFIWPIRIYYEDTDAAGVVYHANYLNFFDRARCEMLEAAGLDLNRLRSQYQLLFVVHSATINYHLPARLSDQLTSYSKIVRLKKFSFAFEQRLQREQIRLCSATIQIACVDSEQFRPRPLPAEFITQFQPHNQLI